MAIAHTLANTALFRDWLATTSYSSNWTGDDASIRRLLESATQEIEDYCGGNGSFGPWKMELLWDLGASESRVRDDKRNRLENGSFPDRMSIPWLISVSSAVLYDDTSRTSSQTLTEGTDYYLTPYANWPVSFHGSAPYTGIKLVDTGGNIDIFGKTGQRVLSITGDYGWQNETKDTGTTATVGSTTGTAITVASSSDLSAGMTLKAGSELLYCESVTNSTTIVCTRGAAGTTATTHSTASLSELVYPPVLVSAALNLARIGWTERVGGMNEEISAGSNTTITALDVERRSVLHSIDAYATHSANQAVTF